MRKKENTYWSKHGFQKHSYQFSFRTTKIQIQISNAIISRHFQPLKGVAVQYAAGTSILLGDSEPIFIVDSESYFLAIYRAAY